MSRPLLEEGMDGCWQLSGDWTLRALKPHLKPLRQQLANADRSRCWRLTSIHRLDSFGALILWRAWGGSWPARVEIDSQMSAVISAIAEKSAQTLPEKKKFSLLDPIIALGAVLIGFFHHLVDFITLMGQLLIDTVLLLFNPRQWPLKEISANFYKFGVLAMPVAALVGFLIGVVLSYLSAMQLQMFGAEVFLINILGLGIIRELGPVLVALLIAGRSGSAMTAQLGVMRVTEELDALSAMGISRTVRLVLPKVVALSLVMPLLVLWTSGVALFGGMLAALVQLDISMTYFLDTLPRVVPVANLYIALSKGVVFGMLISLVACHFGLRIKPNTESLAENTTASVVSSITIVILVDAIFAVATQGIGMPL